MKDKILELINSNEHIFGDGFLKRFPTDEELQKAENNPFLFEIISLTESLKARNIPDKEISEIVTTYITSLGYIRYKEAPKGETESEMLRRFAR